MTLQYGDGNPTPTSGHTIDLDPASGFKIQFTTEGVWTYDTNRSCDIRPSVKLQWVAAYHTLCDAGTPVLCDPITLLSQ
jgi:hypothetical protein